MMEEKIEEKIDLRDYLRIILKHRWTIITVFWVIVITVTIHSFTATPIYKATTRLIIEKENPNVVSFQEVMAVDASGTDYYQTQYKIIESRTVARAVIKSLHLDQIEEFVPQARDDFVSSLIRSVKETINAWIDSIASLFKTDAELSPDTSGEYEPDFELVSDFISRIGVEPIRNSRLVDVGFEAKDPVLSAKIVSALAQAYIDQNLETKLKAVQDAAKWLHGRIDEERAKVETAEQALLRYKEKHDIITDFTSDVEQVTAQKLAQLNTQVVEAEAKRVEAETRYKQAQAVVDTPEMLGSIPEVLSNELIQQIKAMEIELYKRMSELSKKYGQKHPQMLAIESELKTLQKRRADQVGQVIHSLRNEYQVARARENSLKDALARQKKESLELNQKAIEYSVLQREAESAKQMYELLIKRFKETSLTEDMRTGNIRIVDRSEVPRAPIKPKKKLNILLAVILGLVTGTGLAFFFEYLDNTIKTPDDIKRHLNIPYLGAIPEFNTDQDEGPDGEINGKVNWELVTVHSPKSTASEAYRGIRTGILFSSAESEPQVVLVSSAGAEEGKTITTANLAVTMARAGSKVLIIDCDLRRPGLHKIFGIERELGVTNILVGNNAIKDALVQTEVDNLYVIPAGYIPPNPSEILGSKRMTELIETLRKDFKRIIIDSPPVTAVTDATLLGRLADGVILVVRANDKARELVISGLEKFKAVGAHLLGTVLNAVNVGKDSYYYYQYHYYYYGEDGEKKNKTRRKKKSKSAYREKA